MYIFAPDRKANGTDARKTRTRTKMEILIFSRRRRASRCRTGARRGADLCCLRKENEEKESPSFPSPRSCTAQRPSLHCTAAAKLRALFPPPRDCSNSTGEIEARFAYLASPCYPRAHQRVTARGQKLKRSCLSCTRRGASGRLRIGWLLKFILVSCACLQSQ